MNLIRKNKGCRLKAPIIISNLVPEFLKITDNYYDKVFLALSDVTLQIMGILKEAALKNFK